MDVDASNTGFIGAFAVAGAVASNVQPKTGASEKTAGVLAVGFAFNLISGTTKAYLNNATVSAAGNVEASATYSPIVEAFSIGGSYASGGQTSVALSRVPAR